MGENDRETGARIFPARQVADTADEFSQEAAENKPPRGGMGLTEPVDHGDGREEPPPSPATQTTSGLGPAIAERSKDAKVPEAGRQPGARVKE